MFPCAQPHPPVFATTLGVIGFWKGEDWCRINLYPIFRTGYLFWCKLTCFWEPYPRFFWSDDTWHSATRETSEEMRLVKCKWTHLALRSENVSNNHGDYFWQFTQYVTHELGLESHTCMMTATSKSITRTFAVTFIVLLCFWLQLFFTWYSQMPEIDVVVITAGDSGHWVVGCQWPDHWALGQVDSYAVQLKRVSLQPGQVTVITLHMIALSRTDLSSFASSMVCLVTRMSTHLGLTLALGLSINPR